MRKFFPVVMLMFSLSLMAQPELPHDTLQTDDIRYLASPFLSYSPETSLGIGLAGLAQFRLQHHKSGIVNRISNTTASFVYTLKNQVVASLTADLHSGSNRNNFNFDFTWYRYPNSFWGIGNPANEEDEERYTAAYVIIKTYYLRKIFRAHHLGAQWKLKQFELLQTESGGLLDTQHLRGSEGGLSNGIGVIWKVDTRDNYFSTNSGAAFTWSWLHYGAWLGSDYDFNEHKFDFRFFLALASGHVLGTQFVARIHEGDVPFHQMATFGGSGMMRGYYDGRFRDKYSLALQTEYRFAILKRFGGAAFLAAANVEDELSHFKIEDFKVAGGAGLRWKIFKSQDVRLRLDLAVNMEGDLLWYASFSEAF